MKIIKIFLVLCLTHVAHNCGMETEQSSTWYNLPTDNITQMVACSDLNTKENLRSVNKQLFLIAGKNNIENILYHFPCILSHQDHLDCMIQYAKKNNKEMVRRLINTATYCNHADWFSVVPYFIPNDSPDLMILEKYSAYFNQNIVNIFFPYIMAVYGGDTQTLEQYKINYGKVAGYAYYCEIEDHINRISPLNVAVARKHIVSLAQLLVSQNQALLNAKDDCWGLTPIMVAVQSGNVDMCKFLLSCKNIDLTKSKCVGSTLLGQAGNNGSSEIITLLTNYYNTHGNDAADQTSQKSTLIPDLRASKNAFESQLQLDKQTKKQFKRTPAFQLYFMRKIKVNPVRFLQYCYYQELHEKVFMNLLEIHTFNSCRNKQIHGYSAFSATMISQDASLEEKRIFIQELIRCGFKPTPEDIRLETLTMYDEIAKHQNTLLFLLHTHPPADWSVLPQEIRTQIADYIIQLLKNEVWLLPEKY